MEVIKEDFDKLSRFKKVEQPIITGIIISIIEVLLLARFLHVSIVADLLGIQVSVALFVLASRIRKSKHIYLITLFTYEEVKEMSSETRCKIAFKLYEIITISMTIIFVYSMMGIALSTSFILDVSVIISALFVTKVLCDLLTFKMK